VSNKTQGFTKGERLKKRALFGTIFRSGAYYQSGNFSVRLLPNELVATRLGISIQKSVFPQAAQRNRVKRLIRESFRRHKGELLSGRDIIVKPKAYAIAEFSYGEVERALLELFKIAGLLKQV